MAVHCATVSITRIRELFETHGVGLRLLLQTYLTEEELLRMRAFPVRKRKIEWLSGRMASKVALLQGRECTREPYEMAVRYDTFGRPTLGGYHLSISHSRTEAAAVVAPFPCGVDTETFDAVLADSVSCLISRDEVHTVMAGWSCDPQTARTLLWSLKEALFKALGSGSFPVFATKLRIRRWTASMRQPVWQWKDLQDARPGCHTASAMLAACQTFASINTDGVRVSALVPPTPFP